MPRRKRKQKPPTLCSRIVSLIIERGPVKLGVMVRALKAPYQSLNTEALELRRLGVLQKDADGIWSLVPGVNPEMWGIEIITSDSTAHSPPQPERSRTLEDKFKDLLRSAGVRKGIPTIAALFFAGDIWDMYWLHQVLTHYARGFVTEDQSKLIMASWAYKNGVPYKYEDFFKD